MTLVTQFLEEKNMPKIRKFNFSKKVPICTNFYPSLKEIMFIKRVFFFGKNYLKKGFSDLQKNMPKLVNI